MYRKPSRVSTLGAPGEASAGRTRTAPSKTMFQKQSQMQERETIPYSTGSRIGCRVAYAMQTPNFAAANDNPSSAQRSVGTDWTDDHEGSIQARAGKSRKLVEVYGTITRRVHGCKKLLHFAVVPSKRLGRTYTWCIVRNQARALCSSPSQSAAWRCPSPSA